MSSNLQFEARSFPEIDFEGFIKLPGNKIDARGMTLLCAHVLPRGESAARRILAHAIRCCRERHIERLVLCDLVPGQGLAEVARVNEVFDRLEELLRLAAALNGMEKRRTMLNLARGEFSLIMKF